MIGVDANVLVRFLVADDPDQAAVATTILSSASLDAPVYLSQVVLAETWWVLDRAYRIDRAQIVATLRRLAADPSTLVQGERDVHEALAAALDGADFADALIAASARSAGATETVTFDHRAGRRAGMRLLDVSPVRAT